MGLYHFW